MNLSHLQGVNLQAWDNKYPKLILYVQDLCKVLIANIVEIGMATSSLLYSDCYKKIYILYTFKTISIYNYTIWVFFYFEGNLTGVNRLGNYLSEADITLDVMLRM